jgi:cell division protein ZapA
MPNINLNIGGRSFAVACPEGEEASLEAAAEILSADAKTLAGQSTKLSESQMLLIAGLMSADKVISVQEKLKEVEAEVNRLRLKIKNGTLDSSSANYSQKDANPTTELFERLTKLSVKAEKLADSLEKSG